MTNLGAVVFAAAALAYFGFGVPRSDYVVQLASALAMALVGGALVAVFFGALLTHRGHRRAVEPAGTLPPLRLEAERGFAEGIRMSARRWFPFLEIEWDWEEPRGFSLDLAREDGRILERAESRERALCDHVKRRFVIEDAFGLARVTLRREEKRRVEVLPHPGELERSPLLRSLAGGDDLPHPSGRLDGDRVDMRRYVPGDPLRLVLWKVYARTGQLMVRTPERAIAPATRVVAYLPAAYGDEPAAAAARVAVEGGLLGDAWTFSADGADAPATEPGAAVELIMGSRAHKGEPTGDAAGLDRFVEEATRTEPVRVVVFVPARKGPWLDRCAETFARHPGRATAVIVTDGFAGGAARGLDRWLKVPREAAELEKETLTTPEEIGDVARVLRSAGAEVSAVERRTGREVRLGLEVQSLGLPRGVRVA